jgi:octaprenyl-diphosphate synthase
MRRVVEPLRAASTRVGLYELADRLDDVRHLLASDLAALETELARLSRLAENGDNRAKRAAAHLLARPGKRIRPLCVLLGAQLSGLTIDAVVRDVAVACELVHAATLLHDDVIDEGTERRGAPASRMVYGNSASILAGDYLLVEALERVARAARTHGRDRLLHGLLDTIVQMVAAEALQLEQRGRFTPSRTAYLEIIDGKTASLFRWALVSAALLADLPDRAFDALAGAGTALGRAFQLVDDVIDLEGEPAAVGKDLLADVAQGKLTWPLIVAAERDPALARQLTLAGDGHPELLTEVVARVRASGAVEETRRFADLHRNQAIDALSALPDCPARRALAVVVDAAVDRHS